MIPWTDVPPGALCEIASKRRLFVRWPNRAKGTADSVWVPSTTRGPTWAHEPDNTMRGEVQVLAAGLTEKQCEILACSPTAEARLLGPLFAVGNKESIPWVDMPRDSLSLAVTNEGPNDVAGCLVLRRHNDAQFVGTGVGSRMSWPVHDRNPQRGRLLVLAEDLTDEEQMAMAKARTNADVLALRPTRRASRAGQWVAWADVPPGSSVRTSDGREFVIGYFVKPSALGAGAAQDLCAFPYDRSKDPCGPGSAGVYYIVADNLTSVDCDVVQRTLWPPARWAYLTKRAKEAPRDLPRRCLWQDVARPDGASRGGITSSTTTTMDSVLSTEKRVFSHVVREVVREVPQALNDKYATGCSLPYMQLLDEVVRAKWGAPDGWASKPEAVAFLANEIAFRTCSAVPPDSYEACAEAVRTAVESVLSMPESIRSLEATSDGGPSEHGTPSRLLAGVGIHLWESGTRYFGWWGTGPRNATTLAELLCQYVREDTGDPAAHATATLGRDHEYEMGLASGRAVKRDARLTGAWQLAEFVGRCRQALLCGDGQHEEEETGWRDGLLSVPGSAEVVTDGPWPVFVRIDNAHPDYRLGLFFDDGASPAATVNLRLANTVALAVYGHDVKMGTSPYHTNLPWVRRCS